MNAQKISTMALYRGNDDFRKYVDTYSRKHGYLIAESLKHAVVIEYAMYLLNRM